MKNFLIFFSIILCSFNTYTQNNFDYVGAIKLNDSSLITYQVHFSEKSGVLSGYSLTDIGGDHETKSNIIGKYNKDNKTITFKEHGIIYTKSPITQDDFCFVNFKAKNFRLGRTKKFSGNFKGLFPDNTQCIDGEILLSSKEKIDKRIKKISNKIEKSKRIPDSLKGSGNPMKLLDSLNMNVLRKSQVLSMFSKSKKVKLVLFDGGIEDGDKIKITANNITLLDNYEITKEEKQLIIDLKAKKTTINIKALTVGSISTNTAVLKIYVDDYEIKALTNLKKYESTNIDIFLKQ